MEWLGHHTAGAQLLQTAHELLALEAVLADTLPPALARHVRVAHRDGPAVTVIVPGAAYAARLRQMTAATALRFREAGWPVTHIVVRIDARKKPVRTKEAHREIEPLGDQALRSFETLGQQVAPGPLADAINRLLRHHRA